MLTSSTQAFFSSHRNSLEAHLSLLNATQCHTILLPDRAPAVTKQILAAKPMQIVSMPELEFFMTDSLNVEAYPFQGDFQEMRNKTLVILHTSGSTGIPKPVFVTYGTFACNDAHQLIPSLGGNPTFVDYIKGKRLFLAFPLFHAANLTFTIGFGIYAEVTCVLPPPGPLTVDIVNMVHTYGRLHGSLLPPSMIIDVYNNSEYLVNMVRQLQFVAYVGGTLPEQIGDPISSRMKLITLMGSTETMLLPIELNNNHKDWQYLSISSFLGHVLRPSRDGLHELVVVRNTKLDLFQGIFSTFPNINDYPMSDLYQQHPTRPTSWVFRARADDIISFSNSEKLNPVTMESIISAHPAVNSAVIGGHGEFQAALLIEPKRNPTTDSERENLLQDIWPTVVKASQDCPAHGRIMRGFVMFTNPKKPMPRAGKDTVQRYETLKLYAEEFKALYAHKPRGQLQPVVLESESKVQSGILKSSTPKSVGKSSMGNTTAEVPAEKRHVQPPMSDSLVADTAYELDARIEAVLQRVLPGILLQHLGPALAQMMTNLLHPAAAQAHGLNETNGTSANKPSQLTETHGNAANLTTATATPSTCETDDSQVQNTLVNGSQSNGISLDHSLSPKLANSDTHAYDDLRHALNTAISSRLFLHDLSDAADLFECGLDSLQVPVLVDEINAILIKSRPEVGLISNKTIYDNPSIQKLVMVLNGSIVDLEART